MNTMQSLGWTAAVLTVLASGCVSYSSADLSRMSSSDLCEVVDVQGMNLSSDTRRAIDSELQRRNDNCRNHAVEVAQRRELALQREMYGKHDNP